MIDDARNVSAKELAGWLSVSAASINDLARRGVIERTDGKYPLKASIRRYAAHMRRMVTGRGAGTPAEAKGRLVRAQAELAELKARKLAGELIDVELVRTKWIATMVRLRAALLAVPSRVQQMAPSLENQPLQSTQPVGAAACP